ncbi:Uncharacterised protein (plasmid) [Tsukamurella tyrosinosolvens]|uniref:Uncharacterized protein n=1 Tax=Tsukamurella tyrosinosolvens TaxID=57704 RepID=A0A1H4UL89_TSUTY|nr:hypothetical protein [Tsukamurella tyrosinosolvens]KXO99055.1 hypothetical protein AXK58_24175 [Tsukamurella tyrosinosolvens]SEC69340.1 hypothetical protein SAMN04489793_2938 [Tsukamurella tyrosinosolvens]VEH94320.1 Uncharacterised protein [Tsukamurella tyrosinosolvens]
MHPELHALFTQLRERFRHTWRPAGQSTPAQEQLIARWERRFASAPPLGDLRSWMGAHDGQVLEALEVDRASGFIWDRGARRLAATPGAPDFRLDASARLFGDFQVLAATEAAVAAADDSVICLYFTLGG